jgi:hypothetical protein
MNFHISDFTGNFCLNCRKEAVVKILTGNRIFYLCKDCPEFLPSLLDPTCYICKKIIIGEIKYEYTGLLFVMGNIREYRVTYCSKNCSSYHGVLSNEKIAKCRSKHKKVFKFN